MIYYINEGFLEKKKISGKDLEKVVTVARDLAEAMDEDEIKIYKDSMFDFDDETKLPLEIGKCTKAFFNDYIKKLNGKISPHKISSASSVMDSLATASMQNSGYRTYRGDADDKKWPLKLVK